MAYTISESDYDTPSPEYDAELDLQLARIRRRGSALAANSASKDLGVPVSR